MNILWMTRKGDRYLGDPFNRHGFEQAVAKITDSIFAGEGWPDCRYGGIKKTVDRLMQNVDWVIDKDDNLHKPKPAGLNIAHLVSDLHGKHRYGIGTPEPHIDMLNKAGYRALFLRYTELHGTTVPVDIYRQLLKPSAYWLPWSYDPECFFPRHEVIEGFPKQYDVTFIGETIDHVYPLRSAIKAELDSMKIYNTFTANAPRGPVFDLRVDEHLAGHRYANILGSSRIFIFDCSIYRYPLMKFTESLGSGCLTMSTKPAGAEALGLVDGKTYVEINASNWREKLHYYLENPSEARKIADNGLEMARQHHTHEARATRFKRYLTHELVKDL